MSTDLQRFDRPDGHLAYTVTGAGPLVIASPGMGDLRTVFRDLVGPLVAAGFRVACVDLRGHGASATTFRTHGTGPTASDLAALVEHLGGPAVLIGHSISAGSAAIVAAERPELVSALVMLDPHLQIHPAGLMARLQTQLIRRPFGAAIWTAYYRSLHRGRRAPWYDEHVAAVHAALRDPGRMRSFGALARALVGSPTPVPVERVTAPTLVVHSEQDPEFADPAGELAYALAHLTSSPRTVGLLVPDAGHYPHSQRPDLLVPAVLDLITALRGSSGTTHA